MISTLGFHIETEAVAGPGLRVHVIALIDGQPYIEAYRDYPFEALSVYAMGLKDGEVWAFSCECGTPSCAGIHEPMQLTVDASCVRWRLPDEPFADLVCHPAGRAVPHVLVFDRAQYTQAFEQLIAALRRLEQTHGTFMIHPADERMPGLDREIEVLRNRADYRRICRAALGDMDAEDVEFVVRTQEGLELTTPLSSWVHQATSAFLSQAAYDLPRVRQVLERLGCDLRSDPGIVLRQRDIHELSASLRAPGSLDDDGDDAPEHWSALYWTGPDSPSEHLDYWARVRQTGIASVRKRPG